MADDTQGPVSRFLSALASPFRRRTTPEPQMPLYTTGIQEPVLAQGITLPALYAVSQENLILRTVQSKLKQEIFRRGYHWEKKFRKKCVECEEEFHHDVEQCNSCGGAVRDPDPEQVIYPRWLLNQENAMEQSFMDVLGEIESDLNIVDDAFLILIKEYFVDPESGEIAFYRVKNIIRGDPIFMRIIADKRGVRGGRYKICRIHRDEIAYPGQEPKCKTCGADLVDAHYVNMAGSGKNQYYTKGEVIHLSKYNPSKLYGRSPVNTMWRQAMSLTAMDNYIYTAYQKRRTPKGIISVTTDNLESMKSFWKSVDEKMERDPHYVPKVGIESSSGRGGVNWVKFMDTLEEMQYIAVRDEIRNRIAAYYGVSSIFMIDNGKSGGLNNEGLQILVTNRAVEYGQKVYTENLFPRMLKQMDVTDWKLTLYPNEEEDEITRLRRDEMEVNLAQRMAMLGYKPELLEEGERDIRFVYRKQPEGESGMPQQGMPQQGMIPQQAMMAQGRMPPQMMAGGRMPPQMMPPSQPGGEGMGIRTPRSPARPQARVSPGAGSPVSSVQQRGMPPTIQQQNSNAMMGARRPRGQ
mgnify:FL=1